MKNSFPGYYRPTDQELSDMWKNCIFILDANVLLNLYRYSTETSSELINILSKISDRLWIPHQAAFEYHQRRLEVISQQKRAYDETEKLLNKPTNDIKDKLLSNRHPFIKNAKSLIEKLESILKEIQQKLEENKSKCISIVDDDNIKESLTNLLEGKVGKAYNDEKLKEIYEIGKNRYEKKIPPGYLDQKTKDYSRIYGDLIFWLQIIDHSKENRKPIILVTDEKKDDWWLKFEGKIISPRPELRSEMEDEAGVPFYMYRVDPFMEHSQTFLKQHVKQEAIDEVRETRYQDDKNYAEIIRLSQTFKDVYPRNYLREMSEYAKTLQDLASSSPLSELARQAEAIKNLYPRNYLREMSEYAKTLQDLASSSPLSELARQAEAIKNLYPRNYPFEKSKIDEADKNHDENPIDGEDASAKDEENNDKKSPE